MPSTAPSSLASVALGSRIGGRYTVIEQLGSGGMGVVYRVHDNASNERVALKQLQSNQSGARRRKVEALFEREYHTLSRLKHPCIIDVYDYGVSEVGPYYTMELLDGGDLHDAAPVPWREACRHLCDIASSLALLHAHRLVHRDITPRNVRLTLLGRAKLIDFGALTAFGTAADVVGTPLCMAPEVLYRAAVDQRTDLYALGVVAYYLFTGRHAFLARAIEDLPEAWKYSAVPPSVLRPEIPVELDHLVRALTSPDPLSRPLHAAQVIDALCSISGFDVGDYELAVDSFLESVKLVGRDDEQRWLGECVEDTLARRGASVLVSGDAGIGKTRLLREVGLDAQLRGLLVLQADAQATSGYFGVVVALAMDLLDRGGRLAREALQRHAGVLMQLSPRLHERIGDAVVEPLPPNAVEQRARFHVALRAWFVEVAQQRALLMLVDNLQSADESSATLLAALGQDAASSQLLIVNALRTQEVVWAQQPVQLVVDRAAHLELEPLSADACVELVGSLFGDVDNCRRVSKLLYDKSGGNPQHCMELAQLLVRKQLARCVSGTWVLASRVSSHDLPDRLEDVYQAKLANLPQGARALAEALCLHPKPVPIDHCIALADEGAEAGAHAALDTLLSEQILSCSDGMYRFMQDGLRTQLLSNLSEARARQLHCRAAKLLQGSDDLELRMQRGWHLLSAGEEEAGADLLAATSRAFIYASSAREESQSVIAALRAALEVYERRGRTPHQRAGLLFPLILLCYYTPDSSLILKYAGHALQVGREISCLGFALGLAPRLGKKRALELGLRRAQQRFAREQKRRGLQMTLQQAIAGYCSIVPASLGAFGCHYDTHGADRLAVFAEPLCLFGEGQLPAVMYRWMQAQLCFTNGLESDGFQLMQQVLVQLDHPDVVKALGDAHHRSLRGGALFMLGLASCYRGSPQARTIADEMDALGMRLWSMTADQVRLLHHVFRGETERARHYRQRVERSAMQGGPTWHTEMFWPAAMLHTDVLCDDRIAVRRACQHLDRIAATVPSFAVPAAAARAAYASMRGDHREALSLYEAVLEQLPPRRSVDWLPHRGHFARALNRAGEHARAKQLLIETLAHVGDAERATRVLCFEPRRQLAIAEAALGEVSTAMLLLEAMLQEYRPDDNPLLLGVLHHTRAQLAFQAEMQSVFEDNLVLADMYFRATGNPMLVAQASALRQRATASSVLSMGLRPNMTTVREPNSELVNTRGGYSLAALVAAPDRQRYALDLLIDCTGARGGRLYLLAGEHLQLVASSTVDAPARELEHQLLREIRRQQRMLDAMDEPDGQTEIFDSMSAPTARYSEPAELRTDPPSVRGSSRGHRSSRAPSRYGTHHLAVLSRREAFRSTVVGGLVLLLERGARVDIDVQLLDAVADAIVACEA